MVVYPGQTVLRCELRKQFRLDKLRSDTTGRPAMRIPRGSLVFCILLAEVVLRREFRKRLGPNRLTPSRCEFREVACLWLFIQAKLSCDANFASNLALINSASVQQ